MISDKTSVVGIMSGTSCDGVDMAFCSFDTRNGKPEWEIEFAETVDYSLTWKEKLNNAPTLSGKGLIQLDIDYGRYLGQLVCHFLNHCRTKPDLIASHGHTVFHQPDEGYTYQIGNGNAIAAEVGVPVVCDFRQMDVSLEGQGAPLVPVGDRDLFQEYDYCLNIGGFANISFDDKKNRIAFDIVPANIVLNRLSAMSGKSFDMNGDLARSGKPIWSIINKLNQLPWYQKLPPKSLGREWVENVIWPILRDVDAGPADLLSSYTEHIAMQIGKSIITGPDFRVLVTGGGAYNHFLIERINEHSNAEFIIPAKEIVDFKEALIFAYLGLKCNRHEINCLASVTGAKRDHLTGAVFTP